MEQLLQVALQLLQNVRCRIASAGWKRARMMWEAYGKSNGIFSWAPQMKEWLRDPRYIFYLGVHTQP
jgi:hypothetical protein